MFSVCETLRSEPSASITRIDLIDLASAPAWWSVPWALTEIEPPTLKMSVDCMARTAKRGCSTFWISCQVAPGCTVTERVFSLSTILLKPRISSTMPPLRKACPPMLWRTPAVVIDNLLSRAKASVLPMSSTLCTSTTP